MRLNGHDAFLSHLEAGFELSIGREAFKMPDNAAYEVPIITR